MIRSFSANTDSLIILGLGISNAFVALSGALIAQYGKFSDVNLGIGMIIIGLASVIIGEAIFGTKTVFSNDFSRYYWGHYLSGHSRISSKNQNTRYRGHEINYRHYCYSCLSNP